VVDAISFDLDGVIMRGPWLKAVRPRVWSHLGGAPGLAHLAAEQRDQRVSSAILAEHQRLQQAGDFVASYDWDAIHASVSDAYGGERLPDLGGWVSEGCAVDDAIALLPGARAGLERVVNAGLRLVAISNGYYAYQWPVLDALGVGALFESVVTPDRAGFAKPDPRIFQSVPGLVAHVGDLLLHDVLGANRAGITSVWLQPDLPERFRCLPPTARSLARGFRDYLAETLERSEYRPYHPEGTVDSCMPDLVVLDADEAARALLARDSV